MSTITISNFVKSYNGLINWIFAMGMIAVVGIITHHYAPNDELIFVAAILPCFTLWTLGIVYVRSPKRTYQPKWLVSYIEYMDIRIFTLSELMLAKRCMWAMAILTGLMVWGCLHLVLKH